MTDGETPSTPDTLPPAAIADTLPPPGDELPSPRASMPPMLEPAHLAVLQLPIAEIEALLRVRGFLNVAGRGVRLDSTPTGFQVMAAHGYDSGRDLVIGNAASADFATAAHGAFDDMGPV
jgi:hypothetical protein